MFNMKAIRPFLCLNAPFLPAQQLAASIIDVATTRGVNKHKLLRGTGIFSEDLIQGKTLRAEQVLALMARAQTHTAGNDCAFQVGRRLFPGNYGYLSNALLHCTHFGEALRLLTRFKMQICPFIFATRFDDDKQLYLGLQDSLGCGDQWQFILEIYCTALVSASKLLLGQRIPFHFDFPFARPKHIQEYEENLGYRLGFSQPQLRIRVDKEWLNKPFIQQSQNLKRHSIYQAQQQQTYQHGFLDAVRLALVNAPQSNLQQVATLFQTSPATFKRKLKQHGQSFQQIHDEQRRQQAILLLNVQGLNNEQSAQRMDFDDVPNFRRAVKRWTGLTPSQLRGV
ncbi:AraC family transcriptional regulator ligand-binding domain-containing protein [Alteromonadaceae bacterium BrNp21-10]|nr:AraC family transcriptional regulator ligand-binding domain-containing protein [Alteromonadaceae bacterium BrNp21-10]